MNNKVTVTETQLVIPTYLTSEPDKNPLFFEKRVYQGSSGKVYPLPITEKIMDEKTDVTYPAVILENEYLEITILPTLGGRIQRALDKTNHYDFVYYNHVIKPALVGLIGPWISGGIEFNWPQHHRPTTFMPTEHTIEKQADGSITVWVSEIDQMYGTKGMAGFRLYPDKAYIEITGKVYNRTDVPQTFLWWANPAVPANDHTLSVFPPDVHAVMDHGKRAVSDFPIATGTYYKYDYSAGVDISRYKNIKVPTSYMAYHSDYDFIGNYDEELQSGLLHVADHHVSPGKKQWVWGNSDFGQAWDRNLTDEDGPYVELMTGVFTDNQPDFTWLKPYEEKEFKQYFMPYKGVGRIKNATVDAAVNVEIVDGRVAYKLYTTAAHEQVTIEIRENNQVMYTMQQAVSPAAFIEEITDMAATAFDSSCVLTVFNEKDECLVAYTGQEDVDVPLPEPAEEILSPELLKSTEELFLAATHLEQYRHATLDPEQYYLEGLKRDATDIRLNNGYGLFLYKKGLVKESVAFFQAAVRKQTWKTPNPLYGEPLFNLGLAYQFLGEHEKSYDCFYKATWNDDTQGAAFFQLAVLTAKQGKYQQALSFVERALIKNQHNMKCRSLKAALLRATGSNQLEEWLTASTAIDPLDLASHYELSLVTGNKETWLGVMRQSLNNYVETATDYWSFGFAEDALAILDACESESPLIHYYKAAILNEMGQLQAAKEEISKAEACLPDYCFPNKLTDLQVLTQAITLQPDEAHYANYYLGNLLYDKRQYAQAIALWEESMAALPAFPTVARNLSFAYYNVCDDRQKAWEMITKASDLDPDDARILMERDLLASKMGVSLAERLSLLEARITTTSYRDDLYIVYIELLNSLGRCEEAYEKLANRQFHPWEGGEGKASSQYMYALIELAKQELKAQPVEAIQKLLASQSYPHNLGEGKLPNVEDNISNYYIAQAYSAMGNEAEAAVYYKKASQGTNQPESVLYYYDQPADTIFYRGLAHLALKNTSAANSCFYQLISYGKKHQFEAVTYDYFAVSLPATVVFKEDLDKNNRIYCRYLMALGELGLGKHGQAKAELEQILAEVPHHQGAIRHLQMISQEMN